MEQWQKQRIGNNIHLIQIKSLKKQKNNQKYQMSNLGNQCAYGYGCKCSCQNNDNDHMMVSNIIRGDSRNNACSLLLDQQSVVEMNYLKKKLHMTQCENITLHEQLSKLKRLTVQLQQSNTQLQNNLHTTKQHLTQQSQQYTKFLQQKLTTLSQQLQQQQLTIQNHNRFVYNLNQQNELLIGIRDMLSEENDKLRKNYQCVLTGYENKKDEIAQLTKEIEVLCRDVVRLEHMLSSKNLSLLNYQHLINQIPQQQQPPLYNLHEQANNKLIKYKQKALRYKHQRNQLLQQIQQAKQQIGHITLRKYHQK